MEEDPDYLTRQLITYRQFLEDEPPEIRSLLMGPLLSKASIHANTAGVFKGFYEDRGTGVGKFGGTSPMCHLRNHRSRDSLSQMAVPCRL